jgi:hypothetical protein
MHLKKFYMPNPDTHDHVYFVLFDRIYSMSPPKSPPHQSGPARAAGTDLEIDPVPLMTDSESFDEDGDDSDQYFWEGSYPWDPRNWGWLIKNIHCLIRMFEVPAPKSKGVVTRGAESSQRHTLPKVHYHPE